MNAIVEEMEAGRQLVNAMAEKTKQTVSVSSVRYSGQPDALNTLAIKGYFAIKQSLRGVSTDDVSLNDIVDFMQAVATLINQRLGSGSVSLWAQHRDEAAGYPGSTVFVRPDRVKAALNL